MAVSRSPDIRRSAARAVLTTLGRRPAVTDRRLPLTAEMKARQACRFKHHAVTRRQRWRHFPASHQQRKVPRIIPPHDAKCLQNEIRFQGYQLLIPPSCARMLRRRNSGNDRSSAARRRRWFHEIGLPLSCASAVANSSRFRSIRSAI